MKITRFFCSFTNSFKAAVWSIKKAGSEFPNEDAYLISPKVLSICDGLSSWKSKQIDPAKYPWELVSNIEKAYNYLPPVLKYNPQSILQHAVKETTEFGSSTCTIITIHPDKPEIYCGSVGDSGLLVLRKRENDVVLIAQTPELIKTYDDPLTLGTDGITPDEIYYTYYTVQNKDVIILYTDGVAHNMFIDHIIRMVKPFMLLHEIPDLEIIAEMITEKAQALSTDKTADKPYGLKKNQPGLGKPNDITIVIGEISLKTFN
jgi:Stage II sporulation protein E (SpoIIE)